MSTRRAPGRPEATSHGEIEQAAFALFAERGFEGTTVDDIADAVGVGRRTLFRYYRSKNDIPWGQFELTLDAFRQLLAATPADVPLHDGVHRSVLDFNDFPSSASPSHRERMRLILRTPALQAHSILRYGEWRQVIADHVARRVRGSAEDLLPRTAGHVSLALALTAYDVWLDDEDAVLLEVLDQAMAGLRSYLR